MTWTEIQGGLTAGNGSATSAYTFGSSVAVGDLVVVRFILYTGGGTSFSGITDNATTPNTYTLATSEAASSTVSYTYYTVVTTGGAFKVTVTYSGAAYAPISCREYSFTPGTISITTNKGTSTSGSPAAGNVTFTASSALITGAIGTQAAYGTFTPAGSFTTRDAEAYSAGNSMGMVAIDYVGATVSPQNPSGTFTSTIWTATGAAFQSSGDAGGATAYPASLLPQM